MVIDQCVQNTVMTRFVDDSLQKMKTVVVYLYTSIDIQ